MNTVSPSPVPVPFPSLFTRRLSPSRCTYMQPSTSSTTTRPPLFTADTKPATAYSSPAPAATASMSSSRKRARSDDDDGGSDRMSQSPSTSPSIPNAALPQQIRRMKRPRTNMSGRPLALGRLLETLGADEMRGLLRQICERRPDIGAQLSAEAPRPSVQSVLNILSKYEQTLQQAFPVGSQTSEYAYNRVKQQLSDMYDALKDYTPHFLPPNETQATVSLNFLDEVTLLLHRLPNWESYMHNRLKAEAYEEMGKAWALVIREAAKKGAGIQLQVQGWDQKLAKHNDMSEGKMEVAVVELRDSLGWMGNDRGMASGPGAHAEQTSIREQLFAGTYGAGMGVRVGPW